MSNTGTRIAQHLRDPDGDHHRRRPDDDVDYFERFSELDGYMNEQVHPNVNVGAAAADSRWLTDHGAGHVSTVIKRIEDLTYAEGGCVLSPYDTYLILLAAHFHDVGNVFGRAEHERKAKEIIFSLCSRCVGSDNLEKRLIYDIAMAHGGTVAGGDNRDTIGASRHGREIQRLSAILRFADELSDDTTRTSRFIVDTVGTVAPGSAVFHLYADRLRPPEVIHDTSSVKLTFEVLQEHLTRLYCKNDSEVYLLDEIFERTLKTHREQVYCGKFMNPYIVSERTEVNVLVCTERYAEVVGTVSYVFEQTGYPEGIDDISRLAPELAELCGLSAARHAPGVFGPDVDFYDPNKETACPVATPNAVITPPSRPPTRVFQGQPLRPPTYGDTKTGTRWMTLPR